MSSLDSAWPPRATMLWKVFSFGLLWTYWSTTSLSLDPSTVHVIGAGNFTQVTSSGVCVAPWCGYCQRLEPHFLAVAKVVAAEAEGNSSENSLPVWFGTVDITKNPELRSLFKLTAFPTLKLFKDGVFIRDIKGPRTADTIATFLRALRRSQVLTVVPGTEDINIEQILSLEATQTTSDSPAPVSYVILDCWNTENGTKKEKDCAAVRKTVMEAALYCAEDHRFLSRTTDAKSRIKTNEASHGFARPKAWPKVIFSDGARFYNLQEVTKNTLGGVVALAVNPSDTEGVAEAVEALTKVASEKRFREAFKFTWIDGNREFRWNLQELGVFTLPHILVFGSARLKSQLWSDQKVLNLSYLSRGLDGILEGTIPPFSGLDKRARLFLGWHKTIDSLRLFSSASPFNWVFVVMVVCLAIIAACATCYLLANFNQREKESLSRDESNASILEDEETEAPKRLLLDRTASLHKAAQEDGRDLRHRRQ